MSYEYTDPSRADNPRAMPDVEVFEDKTVGYTMCPACGDHETIEYDLCAYCEESGAEGHWFNGIGFYYAFGQVGCLWDSDPIGPFDSYEQALSEAREVC